MADWKKKRGRQKYKNINLENEKGFSDEIKNIVIVFEGLSFGQK